MNAVTLTLKPDLIDLVDCGDLLPAKLCPMSSDEIGKQKLKVARSMRPVADIFDIETAPGDATLRIRGGTNRLQRVGAGMDGGRLIVDGNVGDYLGHELISGELLVSGDAGDFAASGQRDGLIHVKGNVRDYAGGAADAEMRGLKGGTLVVSGLCGDFLGYKMRRGIIIAHDVVGDYCANNMIAGTIILGQKCGNYLGIGMRRGTVLFLEKTKIDLPTFNLCGQFSLPILTVLRHHLHSVSHQAAMQLAKIQKVQRYCGDLGFDGQGEILVAT
ncbi:MAG: formylmethanofuran dehydrogenase subunit C [Pseudomonadota bacterium]